MKKLINIRLIAIGWILGDSIVGIVEGNTLKAVVAAILVFFLLIEQLQATADRRLELLERGKDWIYRLMMDAGWVDIPYEGLVEYLVKVEKELDDTALGE